MAELVKPRLNPRLFPMQQQSRQPRPPKRNAMDAVARRAFRNVNQANELKNPENSIFNEPEYLDYQKRTLIVDISRIENEIKPLKEQYERLTSQTENPSSFSPRSPRSSTETQETRIDISTLMKQSQLELKELQTQQAQMRRVYCVANQLKLEDEIQHHMEEIEKNSKQLEAQKQKLNSILEEIETIQNSDVAHLILEQQSQIESLEEELGDLEEIEHQYMQEHNDKMDQTPIFLEANQKVDSLKRKLASLKYKATYTNVEYLKKRKNYEQRKRSLEEMIKDAQEKKRVSEEKKKTLQMYQKRTQQPTNYDDYDYDYDYDN